VEKKRNWDGGENSNMEKMNLQKEQIEGERR